MGSLFVNSNRKTTQRFHKELAAYYHYNEENLWNQSKNSAVVKTAVVVYSIEFSLSYNVNDEHLFIL